MDFGLERTFGSPGAGQNLAQRYGIWFTVAVSAYYPAVIYVARLVNEGKLTFPAGPLKFATFLYNAVAAVLSTIGFYLMLQDPKLLAPTGWYPEVTYPTHTRMVIVLFCLTKPFEFVDTFLHSALKGKEPSFMHAFHHVATAIASWYAVATNCHFQHNPVFMNLFVHSIMFTYFALVAVHPLIRKALSVLRPMITGIQVIQMFAGTYSQAFVVVTSGWYGDDLVNQPNQFSVAVFGLLMYAVYIYLFGQFFIEQYLGGEKPKSS